LSNLLPKRWTGTAYYTVCFDYITAMDVLNLKIDTSLYLKNDTYWAKTIYQSLLLSIFYDNIFLNIVIKVIYFAINVMEGWLNENIFHSIYYLLY